MLMGLDIAALFGLFGLTGAFAVVGVVLSAWMCWRIADKAGLPGWAGAGAILLTLTGIGSLVSLIMLWVFAYMRWPRDGVAVAGASPVPPGMPPGTAPPPPIHLPPTALPAPPRALPDRRGWVLTGGGFSLRFDDSRGAYTVTGAAGGGPETLVLADPSIGQPQARLLTAAGRIGLEDLGSPGGTYIDGARLLPAHGPRDITAARTLKFGNVELALSRT